MERPFDRARIEDEPYRLPIKNVVRELVDLLGRKTVAYLAGLNSTNPRFDFESPASVLRDRGMAGRTDVVRAARVFVAEAIATAQAAHARTFARA
jgi:hypothetical protein